MSIDEWDGGGWRMREGEVLDEAELARFIGLGNYGQKGLWLLLTVLW
jgi:hypothetical protein